MELCKAFLRFCVQIVGKVRVENFPQHYTPNAWGLLSPSHSQQHHAVTGMACFPLSFHS